jgi:hypothetical protein
MRLAIAFSQNRSVKSINPRFALYSVAFVAISAVRGNMPGFPSRNYRATRSKPAAIRSCVHQLPPGSRTNTACDESGVQFLSGASGRDQVFRMKIRVGFEMIYDFPRPTPLIALVGTHFTRASDVLVPDHLTISPFAPITPYRDGFGNWCSRIVAPAGRVRLAADGTVHDSGLPDVIVPAAAQHAVEDLPADTIVYLLGSRYCETDRLSDVAWRLFEKTTPGWTRVQALRSATADQCAAPPEAEATDTLVDGQAGAWLDLSAIPECSQDAGH